MTVNSYVVDGEKMFKDISSKDKLVKSPEDYVEVTRKEGYKPQGDLKDGQLQPIQ